MAQLIDYLVGGARDDDGEAVSSGSAYFYAPGSSTTEVTVYSDEDGLTPVAQPVALDAGGRATVYVRQQCRLIVLDSSGDVAVDVDRCVAVQATNVEVQNAGFSGTNLTTLATGVAGGRTDLDTVLTRAYESFGDTDFLVNGSYIQDLIGDSTSVWLNVRSSAYNAQGDGTTDDTARLQAAFTAAAVAAAAPTSGDPVTVYIPPGTYKISSAITITVSNIRVVGAGPGVTIIRQGTSAANWFTLSSSVTNVSFEGLGFTANATGLTGTCISASSSNNGIRVDRCVFNGHNGPCLAWAGTDMHVRSCKFTVAETSMTVFPSTAGGSGAIVSDCYFSYSVSPTNTLFYTASIISNCYFSGSAGLTLTVALGSVQTITGCLFTASSGTVNLFSTSASTVTEHGNVAASGLTFRLVASAVAFTSLTSTSFNSQAYYTTGSATSLTVANEQYGSGAFYIVTTGAAMSIGAPNVSAPGMRLTIWYKNSNAGGVTPTLNAAYTVITQTSLSAASTRVWEFVHMPTLTKWVAIQQTDYAL